MAKQIIVTQNDYGIELETQFVDDKKKPLDITDYDVRVKIIYDDKTIDTVLAEHKDSVNGIAYIVLEKEHLINAGLHTSVWSVVDEDEHVTAQENVYYFVKDVEGSEDDTPTTDLPIDADGVLNKFNEIDNNLFELTEQGNVVNEEIDSINETLSGVNEQLDNIAHDINTYFLNIENYPRMDYEFNDDGRFTRILSDSLAKNMKIFIPLSITLTSEFIIPNHIVIEGADSNISIINYDGAGTLFTFYDENNVDSGYGKGSYYNKINNIKLKGNGHGIALSGEPRYFSCKSLIIENFDILMSYNNNWTNKFENCLFNKCNTWYKSINQNNAISFVNCIFNDSVIGFDMLSVYNMNFYGGNIEVCEELIFKPSLDSGCQWSNINIDGVYFETEAQLIKSNNSYSFNIYGFNMKNCNVNFFQPTKAFIDSEEGSIYFNGEISNNVFYKSDNSNLFNMKTTPIEFKNNVYRYYDNGVKKTLTEPFSTFMKTWNTGFLSSTLEGNNTLRCNGKAKYDSGMESVVFTFSGGVPPTYSKVLNNSLFIDGSDNNKLKFKNSNGEIKIVTLT